MEIRKARSFDLREDIHWKDARRIPMFRNGQKAMSEYSTLQSKLTDVGRSQWEVALKCNSDTANPSKWRDGLSQFPTVEIPYLVVVKIVYVPLKHLASTNATLRPRRRSCLSGKCKGSDMRCKNKPNMLICPCT